MQNFKYSCMELAFLIGNVEIAKARKYGMGY